MKYILATTALRKNGKRHIDKRSDSIDELKNHAKFFNRKRFKVEIYTGNWQFVERI